MFSESYDEWVKCITIKCEIPLTTTFLTERLEKLRDPNEAHTHRYIALYGQQRLDQVIGWFERALEEQGS